ncbi:MAG TPA: hypothetical protein DCL48_00705 [Alphaproteobacteria bacterium]|nr:hypothetical protein [Alphaproteobacteria bacterium]
MSEAFILHPTLAADTIQIAHWPLCEVLLMDDSRFTWVILVPRRAGATEWFDLGAEDASVLHKETLHVARQLKALTGASKINIGALGNVVSQLHVHVVARMAGDAGWPGPVWGLPGRTRYTDDEARMLGERLSALTPPG